MKKIIIAACMALLGCGSVFAQQGKQAIGGNLSYGTYNPQIEMFARFKMKSSFHKTKRII